MGIKNTHAMDINIARRLTKERVGSLSKSGKLRKNHIDLILKHNSSPIVIRTLFGKLIIRAKAGDLKALNIVLEAALKSTPNNQMSAVVMLKDLAAVGDERILPTLMRVVRNDSNESINHSAFDTIAVLASTGNERAFKFLTQMSNQKKNLVSLAHSKDALVFLAEAGDVRAQEYFKSRRGSR